LAGPTEGLAAQERDDDQPRWGFAFNLGAGDVRGDFASSLEELYTGDYELFRDSGLWRYGLGVSFGSLGIKEPYEDELEFGLQRIFLSGTRRFRTNAGLQPYVQGRAGIVRLHPRSSLFDKDSLPPDFEIGDSPTPAYNGFHIGVVPGVEVPLGRSVALDVSLMADYFHVGDVDLGPIGQPSASSGLDYSARLGIRWWNDASAASADVWGVSSSWGWGLGEALGINFAASAMNEYVRNANFNQISPRSWWRNIEEGFTYDDNEFATNQFIHPFNGSQYFNAARSNGLGFWSSYGVALVGALHWELAGETHPMSLNDLISTGIGGGAVGEAQYRFSSMMLDSEATGGRRFFREAGAFLVDPIRGFNRVVSGRAWEVRPNPTDRQDTNPAGQVNGLYVGWRRVGNDHSLTKDVEDYGVLEYYHQHGNLFEAERRSAFDYFTFDGQLNFGDKTGLGLLMIRGNLHTARVGEADVPNHMLAVVQHFQYINNDAYEFGGQSFGGSFFSRFRADRSFGIQSRFDLLATLLGAVNSDAASLADVPDQERLREYDYGPGGGGRAQVELQWKRRPFFSASYQLHFLYTVNGSVFQSDEIGLDSRHWLHGVDARLDIPIARSVGLGARFTQFTRESHYDITLPQELPEDVSISGLIKQKTPELRVYVSYVPSVR